jgi:uncharacterized protein
MLPGLLGCLLAWPATAAQAVEIKDDAGFFSQKALDKANDRLADLKKAHGKEVRIETIKTVPGGNADEVAKMDRAAREKFFAKLARDRATAEHAKGIFILICKHPGHVQIEEDKETRNQGFGITEWAELRETLVAGLRHKEYDKALLDSVDYIAERMKNAKPHAERGAPATAAHRGDQHIARHENRDAEQPARRVGGMGWLGWVIVAVVILLGIRLIGALFSGFGGGGGGYGPGGYGGGGGGGFMGSLMTGMLGAFAGNWLYHQFFDTAAQAGTAGGFGDGDRGEAGDSTGAGEDWEGGGGDFDDQDKSDGGGDFDGGDSGGGDFGGGDFGGGDFGGGGDF